MPPHRLARVCRSEVLWTLGGFVGLQLVLAVAIGYGLPKLRDPAYVHAAHALRQRSTTEEHPLTVVMFGGSHTQNGLRAREIEERLSAQTGRPIVLFNFGVAGAGPLTHLVNLKRLCAAGIHPDLVLIDLCPSQLATTIQPRETLKGERYDRRELAQLQTYNFPLDELRREWWTAQLVPCYGHRGQILRNIQGYWRQRIGPWGWDDASLVFAVSPEEQRQGQKLAWEEHGEFLKDYHLGGASAQAVRDLCALCRAEGMAFALVLMPEGSVFRSWYSPDAEKQLQTFLTELEREFQAPLFDTRTWIADDDFTDGHHLTGRGAKAFSERFGREALLPLLQQRYPAHGQSFTSKEPRTK